MLKVANIIEEGRLGGPQVRIAEVARALGSASVVSSQYVSGQRSEDRDRKSEVRSQEKVGSSEYAVGRDQGEVSSKQYAVDSRQHTEMRSQMSDVPSETLVCGREPCGLFHGAGRDQKLVEGASVDSGQHTEVRTQRSDVSNQKAADRKHTENGKYDEVCAREEEIETTVIYPQYESEAFQKKLEEYDVSYIRLPLHRLAKGWKYLLQYMLWFPLEIFFFFFLLKKHRFDVVHVSGGSWQVKGVIAGKLAGCRVLWHLNDTKMPGLVRAFFRIVARWGVDGFIVAGERVREYYVEELGFGDTKPVFEIQAPVNCSYFDPSNVQVDKGIAELDGIKIVSVGNVNPLKGIEYFLDAAEELNQNHKDLHFFIVGPHWSSQQAYSKRLERIKAEKNLYNVTFYGSSSDVRRIHKAADIYVCSSIAEASPLSVWEAMAMEKAIVATDVGDIRRFITHGENGYIVPPADSGALAHYVGRLVQERQLREDFGKKARQAALENLDISIVAGKHIEAYRSIF